MRRALLITAAMLLAGCQPPPEAPRGPASVVYLVRHAEKADDGTSDPPLTAPGEARAEGLADLLSEAGIDAIFTTPYVRTRETARPLAGRLGLGLLEYDPEDLSGFADALRRRGGRSLVSGHSNTTPELVRLLGGDAGPPIVEATEYDRLYVLVGDPAGSVTTVLLRYGTPSPRP